MGCGQSKIHLYPRKNKNKANGKKSGHGECFYDYLFGFGCVHKGFLAVCYIKNHFFK